MFIVTRYRDNSVYISIGTIYIMLFPQCGMFLWELDNQCIYFHIDKIYHGGSHSVVCFYRDNIYHGCSHSGCSSQCGMFPYRDNIYHGCSHSVVCFYRDNIYHGCSKWYVSIGKYISWWFPHDMFLWYTVVEQPQMWHVDYRAINIMVVPTVWYVSI